MVTVVATFKTQDGMADSVLEALRKSAAQTRQEPGNIRYDLFQSANDPTVLLVYEDYADQAALDAHGSSEYVKDMFRALRPMLAGRPEIRFFPEAK